MGRQCWYLIGWVLAPGLALAQQSIYCPQNHGYINVGMTQDQVIAACGQPLSKQDSNQPVMQKIPVKQLIYNAQGASRAFYGVWSLPIGNSNIPDTEPFGGKSNVGANLQVNVINNKISSISLNGSSTNGFSICNNQNLQVGDPVNTVYNACGEPSLTNNTYINQPIQSSTKPQIWVYQPDPYQPSIHLTFVDGKLQSIN